MKPAAGADTPEGSAGLPQGAHREAGPLQRLGWAALERMYGGSYRKAQHEAMARTKPLRVLRAVSNLTQGGVGKVCLQTSLAMDCREAETSILVFGEKPRHVAAFAERVDVPVEGVALRIAPYERARDCWRGVREFAARIEASRPVVVHLHEPQFVLAARAAVGMAARRGAPCRLLVHLHSDYRQRPGWMPEALLPRIRKALAESELIACSRSIEDAALDWLRWLEPNVTRIEDGADDRVVARADSTGAADLREAADGRPVAACMANLVPQKRIEDFIDACALLIDAGTPLFALLMVYGKKEAEAAMRRRFESRIAPGAGMMLYRVGQPHELLREVAIGVSPSSLEGLGLNILEYQAQGIPVVCTDLTPHREMVDDGVSGILYPVGDVAALAEALGRLLGDAALRGRIGRAGRETAMRRRWSDTAAATVALYHKIIAK